MEFHLYPVKTDATSTVFPLVITENLQDFRSR